MGEQGATFVEDVRGGDGFEGCWPSSNEKTMASSRCVRSWMSPAKGRRLKKRANLNEALTLFFETADPSEARRRYHGDVLVTEVEVPVG